MKKLSLIVCVLFGLTTNAQTPYVDVMTAPLMGAYSQQIKEGQEKTIDEMNSLQKAQGWVSAQMTYANDVQDKIYKGLKEVNGTLRNGIQVKNIYSNLERTVKNMDDIKNEVKTAPEYSILATSAMKTVVNKSVDIYADVADLLTSGDLNLATSGDRRKLLYNIEMNTRLLNVYLVNVKLTIRRAKRKGFWKSINPFQTYVNTDKAIFQRIMRNAGHLK